MKKIALTFAILMIPASAALADQPKYTGGMKYTTMQPAQTSDTDKKPIYNRIVPKNEESVAEETLQEKPAEETVWDRYKELAAGKEKAPDTEEGSALPKAPKTPDKPTKQAEKEETQRPSGMAGLIQEYQRNRNKRSQMRSISFSKPETPEVEKPDVNVED